MQNESERIFELYFLKHLSSWCNLRRVEKFFNYKVLKMKQEIQDNQLLRVVQRMRRIKQYLLKTDYIFWQVRLLWLIIEQSLRVASVRHQHIFLDLFFWITKVRYAVFYKVFTQLININSTFGQESCPRPLYRVLFFSNG